MSAVPVSRITHSSEASGPQPANDSPRDQRSLLRFITCGSVDDGKSTLIGRLLFDAGTVPDDILAGLKADSARIGNAGAAIDYSLLVDGLQAEREQGITIDVAYRYFATPRRSFIVADTPGHEQYTRNMATGASSADVAVILIDAGKGVLPQTRRHSLIMSLVGVRHVIVAINKMDLIGFDEARFRIIEAAYRESVAGLGFTSLVCIPVTARDGDNITSRSERTPWYAGPSLLGWLEGIDVDAGQQPGTAGFVLPIQWVNRPDATFRGFAGTIAAGTIRPGDAVVVLPSGQRSRVSRIVAFDGDLALASAGQAVTLTLESEIDISRGDVLVAARQPQDETVKSQQELFARLLVTAGRTVGTGDRLLLKLGSGITDAVVERVLERIDIHDFSSTPADALALNALGLVHLRLERPVVASRYADLRALGSLILIDRATQETVAIGVVVAPPRTAVGPLHLADRVKQRTERTLSRSLGQDWRQAIGPILTWRLASAAIVGGLAYAFTGNPALAIGLALADAILRPALRLFNRVAWQHARSRPVSTQTTLRDGAGI